MAGIPQKRSQLEIRFLNLWKKMSGPKLVEEFQFHPERKWRFDFADLDTKTAIEIEGGVWNQSRHTRPAGFIKDCEKYNTGTLLGWKIFRLPGHWITKDTLEKIKEYIICQKTTQNTPPPN